MVHESHNKYSTIDFIMGSSKISFGSSFSSSSDMNLKRHSHNTGSGRVSSAGGGTSASSRAI